MSNNTIQAIPSYYKDTLMRSRVECRWALILDKIGLAWEYEAQGFDLGDKLWYLPDFTVYADEVFYLEVKGAQPDALEIEKATRLAKGLKTRVVVVWNGIPAKLSQLYAVSINKHGKQAGLNPLVSALQSIERTKRERILGLARSYKFD
jgi:hypothetical protein